MALHWPRVTVFAFSHVFTFVFNSVTKGFVPHCDQLVCTQLQCVVGEGKVDEAENTKSHLPSKEWISTEGKEQAAARESSFGWSQDSQCGRCLTKW